MKKIILSILMIVGLTSSLFAINPIGCDMLKVSQTVNSIQGADSKSTVPSDVAFVKATQTAPASILYSKGSSNGLSKKIVICKNIAAASELPGISGGYIATMGEGGV